MWRMVAGAAKAAASSTTAGGGLTSLAEQKGGIHTPMHTQTVVFRSKKVGTAAAVWQQGRAPSTMGQQSKAAARCKASVT